MRENIKNQVVEIIENQMSQSENWDRAANAGLEGLKPFFKNFLLPILLIGSVVYLLTTLIDIGKDFGGGNSSAWKDNKSKIAVMAFILGALVIANLWIWGIIGM